MAAESPGGDCAEIFPTKQTPLLDRRAFTVVDFEPLYHLSYSVISPFNFEQFGCSNWHYHSKLLCQTVQGGQNGKTNNGTGLEAETL